MTTFEYTQICADVRDVQRGTGTPVCDLVVAGIPCTGASRAGKAKNKLNSAEQHPSAGSLFIDFLDFVRIRPAIPSCVTKLVSSYAAVTDQSHSPDASAGA
ncbi:hypothetical protein CFBP6411_01648 [Pseudomonas syringae group genomosp. 3]|uniref:Uncharacterized protein n=1 Tax=Pseudomonas syringae group genomosp. 3 TaxID=251701 RepID=A0A2K4WAV6_9PSED|nr:hypothetical protein CFBP6411_01648 [Pseudomonas syringae group genomosp. 3]